MTTTYPPSSPLPIPPGNTERPSIDAWQFYSLAEAYQERPPVCYVVEGIFEIPSLNIVFGSPGCFKSFLLADMALCVAAGRPWLPPAEACPGEARATTQVTTAWLDFDNGPRRSHDRCAALGRAMQLPADIPFRYVTMPMPRLDGGNQDMVFQLGLVLERQGARLVVVDNLACVSGGRDENSTAILPVLENFAWLAHYLDAAVIIIHHERKSTGFNSPKGEMMRGNSGIPATLDLGLRVRREPGSPYVTLEATKERGGAVPAFAAEFVPVYADPAARTKELREARFYAHPTDGQRRNMALYRLAVEALRAGGPLIQKCLTREIMRRSGLSRSKARQVLLEAEAEGLICARRGENNALVYSVAGPTD